MKKHHLTERTFEIARDCEAITEPYFFTVHGLEFTGLPGVLSPLKSPSTRMWKGLPISPGQSFLEIGCGTGVFSVIAAIRGASIVTAVDINPQAIANTLANARRHGVQDKIEAFESDIFRSIPEGRQYDVILWNIPWSHTEKIGLSLIEQATFDPSFVLLERYLAESPPFLAAQGRLLLGYSSTFGNVPHFRRLADYYHWNVELLYQVGSADTCFAELFQLTRLPPSAESQAPN